MLAGRWQDALDLADMSLARTRSATNTSSTSPRCTAIAAGPSTRSATPPPRRPRSNAACPTAREAALDLEIAATLATRAALRAGTEAEADRAEARRILDAMGATPNWLDLYT